MDKDKKESVSVNRVITSSVDMLQNVFKKNDNRTIYNVAYRDGKTGVTYVKRFSVTSVTRDKEYDLTKGSPRSEVLYFSENQNGEADPFW